MSDDLEPLDPRTAKQMYLDDRRHELAEATLQSHDYRLKQFVKWCEANDIKNLNNFSGRDIHRFRVKRREEDELATATMKCQLATLRMFLRFCASIDAVEAGLDDKIILPRTTEEDTRDEMLAPERAQQILAHLEQYEYAKLEHALLEVLWHTGIRIGAACGVDVDDYNPDKQYLELAHRPDSGTALKNQKQGERLVALSDRVCAVLDDWLAVNHPGPVDEYGRKPLFVTRHGRLSRNRGRTIAYQYTRPCVYTDECPHDRDLETGEMHADAPKVDISPTVERAAVRLDTIDGEVTEGRETERKTLLEEFISAFAADNLLSHVQSKFYITPIVGLILSRSKYLKPA